MIMFKGIKLRTCILAVSAWLTLIPMALAMPSSTASRKECTTKGPDGPMQITIDCIDPTYGSLIVDGEANETMPIPHRRVFGHFNNTDIDFNIYLPEKASWAGRFFQLAYPVQNSTANARSIEFGAESGGYTVQISSSGGYRASAAIAKLSRKVARDYYQDYSRKIYGYVYGGSGGSYQVIGAMENTFGVWDGSVALIQAVPISDPYNWCIRALGGLVLESKAAEIIDAVSPGGGGDPFSILDASERAILDEVTALGIPLHAWEDFEGVGQNRTQLWFLLRIMVIPIVKQRDPTYVNDFWSKPGYLGTEQSAIGDLFRNTLVDFNVTVREVHLGADGVPVQITIDEVPSDINVNGLEFTVVSGDGSTGSFTAYLVSSTNTVVIDIGQNATTLATLSPGTQLLVDNRWFLAVHGFHRHQVPTRSGFYGYDYLRDENGDPIYPQRDVLVGTSISEGASGGGTHTGNITAKTIVMDNLHDFDAFPWHADWYRSQVKNALRRRFDDNYRLHYSDNADHSMGSVTGELQTRLVDFTGLYEQHLRDLSAWVENGIEPPEQTRYKVEDGQVEVPQTAAERRGIQPVVDLTVSSGNRTEVSVGNVVTFKLHVEVPQGTGKVVSTEWDFYGVGDFVVKEFGKIRSTVDITLEFTYDTPGTYLPAVRVASQREGDAETQFARALNLGRVRVVVRPLE
ncbi:hypothetical protein EDB80DRAFT_865564 [Ilyonectria destructans]|nr:hypothetical protein EDB80DRAFT_865564 [Ilyonectria destructans]